jgi:chemotaxis protein methyltransferase CheR
MGARMTEVEFAFLRGFLKTRSGLSLTAEKRYLAESRLAPVCRRFEIDSLSELVTLLRRGGDRDLECAVVEAMSTNETSFFRDRIPFDLLRGTLLPRFLEQRAESRRLRIWCAASSTGQEPYSVAMILHDAAERLKGWQVEVLATDLSPEVLAKARAGLYSQFEVQRGLPIQLLLAHFTQVGAQWQIAPQLRAMVTFRTINLVRDFGALGAFDIIYCRNVLIYFDAPTRAAVLRRLAAALAPDGALLLGAAESVHGLSDVLSPDLEHRGLYGKATPARPGLMTPPLTASS